VQLDSNGRYFVISLQQWAPSVGPTRPSGPATAERFQQEVADLLELPPGSGDAEVRKTLLGKGPDFLAWYDTRLQATAELRQPAHCLNRSPRTARRIDPRH
jgi:hypothetical protein